MPTIDIKRSHNLGKAAGRAAAEQVANRLKDKVEATWKWVGDDIVFERTGAKGRIAVTDTTVHIEIDLSLVLRPLKGMLESKANKYLDEYIK